eukprot:2114302-Prymnesium_polylepis.2
MIITMPDWQQHFWPANFSVGNPWCVEDGFYHPFKPRSTSAPSLAAAVLATRTVRTTPVPLPSRRTQQSRVLFGTLMERHCALEARSAQILALWGATGRHWPMALYSN